ncbi:hypothetical protein JMA_21720 [Jeotgalibacillus malaysiensis]|uniref:UPF0178 protein JMA_21720 n=1 Tax=Jeotgalibacillus malaysiensis TaxID=1508404 RepID=A0A0B5AU00_9BACL|nr:DUF188 domain-containing protein [Jeotgalibacillus malaysiensis]AJD91489.1 hypothetical protein JMA_21720 [Jeotgalibacillus malaysiensis]
MEQDKNISIYVDADACPGEIKNKIMTYISKADIRFVATYNHYSANEDQTLWTYIDAGSEAVDMYILNRVKAGDLVITQDIGLASLVLPKGVYAISPRGKEYNQDTIETSLSFRYLYQEERKKGRFHSGPKKVSKNDLDKFTASLKKFFD